jgi:hypothetical protein
MTPIKIDVATYKVNRDFGLNHIACVVSIVTTYDGYYTIMLGVSTGEEFTIPNNYPRFTSVEKAEGYWNKIKHKFK